MVIIAHVLPVAERAAVPSIAGLANGTPDVREHLKQLKAEVLHGVRICFTKIIPLAMADPEQHPLWRLAELVILCYAVCNASSVHAHCHLL